jgi:hypothetical protein
MYKTLVEVRVRPVGSPTVIVQGQRYILNNETWFVYHTKRLPGPYRLSVAMIDKADSDPDTAVEIVEVRINGISNPKFAWAGVYHPVYPEPWASTQTNLPKQISPANYLGWNGVWHLDITVPAFKWIHQTLGLGWIYE